MKKIEQLYDLQSILLAQSTIGMHMTYVSGITLPEFKNHLGGIKRIELGLQETELSFELVACELDFRGYIEDYGRMRIRQSAEVTAINRVDGGRKYQFRNQVIESVSIIRESIQHSLFGEDDWNMLSDIGIVLALSGGSVAIYKAGYQSIQLEVAFASKGDALEIPDRQANWNFSEELGEKFVFDRNLISIEDALKSVMPN